MADLVCVARVTVRAKCYVSRVSKDSGRAKIGSRAEYIHIALRLHGNTWYAGYGGPRSSPKGDWGAEGTFEGLTMNVEFCQDNSADQRNSQFPKT